MEENKTRTYLLYAVGEIALVMIGILLALQVNNWNEERKLSYERTTVLNNLSSEFTENIKELKVSIDRLDSLKEGLSVLLNVMHDQPDTLSIHEFETLLGRTFYTPTYSPSSFVLEELKNSGGLTRLNNEQIESILFDWERHNADLKVIETRFSEFGTSYIIFLTEHGSVRNLDAINANIPSLRKSVINENKLDLLNNPIFENHAQNFYYMAYQMHRRYVDTIVKAEKIIELTEN